MKRYSQRVHCHHVHRLSYVVRLRVLNYVFPYTFTLQGRVFLDRDPKHFRLVLNYLRDGNVCLPNCSIELHEILQEANFYQVQTQFKLQMYHCMCHPSSITQAHCGAAG